MGINYNPPVDQSFKEYNFLWLTWKILGAMQPAVSSDNGDASVTLTPGQKTAITQVWNTPLTAPRTVTLATVGVTNGGKFRVVRTTAATGASTLTVAGKALAAGQWCDAEFNGTSWIETAFGSL